MRGGLKFLLAPDIPVELVSGRRLPGEMLPAHFRHRRGWTTGSVAVTVPVRPFDLTRGSTMLVMTQSPTGAVAPGTSDILRLNDGSTFPALTYNSAAGIRYQGVSAGTLLTASDFYNGGVEYKALWAVSQPGQHEVWIDGTQKATATDAGFGPLTVTQVILGALNSDVRRLYVAVFDRYLSPDERAEIDRDPAILTRPDTVSVYFEAPADVVLTAASAGSATTASTGALAQAHGLAAAGASSGAASATGAIVQRHALTGQAASSATAASTASIGQRHALTGAAAAAATVASAPAVAQTHVLAGAAALSATAASTGAIASGSGMAAAAAASATTASTPAIGQTHQLAGSAASSATAASTGALSQGGSLAGSAAASGTTASTPTLSQRHILTGSAASSATNASTGAMIVAGELAGASATSQTAASSPAITQRHVLAGSAAQSAVAASAPAMGATPNVLVAAPVAVDSVAQASAIVQRHLLAAAGCASASLASSAALGEVPYMPATIVSRIQPVGIESKLHDPYQADVG